MNERDWRFATRAVHAGERAPRPDFTPVVTPIHNAVTYIYPDMETLDRVFADASTGYVYGRYGNPTNAAFEAAVASLEGGEAALSFASGMAALHAALLAAGARAGAAVLAAQDLYGATFALLSNLFTTLGVSVRFADFSNTEAVVEKIRQTHPAVVLFETISNPLLKLADIPRIAEMSHAVGARVIVDNTFASPYLVCPLEMDADYTMHSSTKYLSGHGDVLAGVVVCNAKDRAALLEITKMVGGNLGPNEAWLAMRGLKTLPLRVQRQCENAAKIAAWLEAHPKVSAVHYPGLASHPQHTLAGRLLRKGLYGAMISFDIKAAGRAEVFRFLEALQLCLAATSMGDIYTLALYPAHSSHRALTAEQRAAIGIGDGLVRLSVGIEDADDLIGDLEQALEKV
jgi:cystathionine beta-lyase/cystathionine gamma-synthase